MGKFLPGKRKKSDNTPRRRHDAGRSERTNQTESDQQHSFRRNRTLTGSSSARVASGNELNAELRSPRAHVHHLSSMRRRLWLYLLIILTVSATLFVFLSQTVASFTVQVAGTSVVPTADQKAYTDTIERYYDARPAERLRFALNIDELRSHVQATNPEVKDISVSSTGEFGKAEVHIVARTPIARWSINGSSQYVDASGVVFARNFHAAPTLQIVDKSGVRADDNQIITSQRFLGFVGRIVGIAQASGIDVSKITIPSQTTRQVDINLRGVRQRYKLSVDRLAGEQVEDVARITRYLHLKGITPSYVDVRVKGKAFYR